MSQTALLLSIRPRFVELIFSGSKRIELRRSRPRVKAGDLVFVYASSPTMALVGAFEISGLVEETPAAIWRKWGGQSGITKAEFDDYFDGREVGFGLVIAHAWRLPSPVKLSSLRKRQAGFHPPQSYHYLPITSLNRLGGTSIQSIARK